MVEPRFLSTPLRPVHSSSDEEDYGDDSDGGHFPERLSIPGFLVLVADGLFMKLIFCWVL